MSFKLRKFEQIPPLKYILGVVLFLAIIGYGFFEGYDILCGPELEITSPLNGSTVHNPLITVTGKTKRIAKMFIDGNQSYADEAGFFSEPLLLAYGYNIIEVKVQDQFGREIVKTIALVLN